MIHKSILVVYPLPAVTQIAVYQNIRLIFLKTIRHDPEELAKFNKLTDQQKLREQAVIRELQDNEIPLDDICIVISRGGLVNPLRSGVYEVNQRMKEDLILGLQGTHAANLGGLIADRIAGSIKDAKAYVADSAVVDELDEVARVTGHPCCKRKSIFHALNHKFFAREYAKSISSRYEDLNLIIAHVSSGGGVSVGAHKYGRVIDVNQALDGDGPFSLNRTGSLPLGSVIDMCFSGKLTKEEITRKFNEESGLLAYLGTTNLSEIEDRIINGDEEARFISYAMAYQIAKEIGAMYAVLEGSVDAILLTGNIFNSKRFTEEITSRIRKISKIVVYPIVNDIEALARNALMVIKGETEVQVYN